MKYIIASRGSKLALYQAHHVQLRLQQNFPQHSWEVQTFTTTGDRFLDRPLSSFGGKGAFLKELEEALLAGNAHLAVHSLKDVPGIETPGLKLVAFLSREDPRDVWVSKQEDLAHLATGKKVGTSSLRRQLLIRLYRPDLNVELLRGNLDTRLRKLREGQYDAIVVAAAGLHRLELFDDSFMQYLLEDAFIPAIGQGIMVVQASANSELTEMVRHLNDSTAETAAQIERKFLEFCEGGCHLPVGGHAKLKQSRWQFHAFIGGVRSYRILQDMAVDENPDVLAPLVFKKLESQGARELLAEINETASE